MELPDPSIACDCRPAMSRPFPTPHRCTTPQPLHLTLAERQARRSETTASSIPNEPWLEPLLPGFERVTTKRATATVKPSTRPSLRVCAGRLTQTSNTPQHHDTVVQVPGFRSRPTTSPKMFGKMALNRPSGTSLLSTARPFKLWVTAMDTSTMVSAFVGTSLPLRNGTR